MPVAADTKYTHGVLEYSRPTEPAQNIKLTHGSIEWTKYPTNVVWYTHGVIEIAYPTNLPPPPPPPPPPPGNRNPECVLVVGVNIEPDLVVNAEALEP